MRRLLNSRAPLDLQSVYAATYTQGCIRVMVRIGACSRTNMPTLNRYDCISKALSKDSAPNDKCSCGGVDVHQQHCGVPSHCRGVRTQVPETLSDSEKMEMASKDLKFGLEGLATNLFGDVEMRWVDAYFPFTSPSTELEILFKVSALKLTSRATINN